MQESTNNTERADQSVPVAWPMFGSTAEFVNLVSDFVFAFDGDMRIVCVNTAFDAAFGKGGGSAVLGHSLCKVLDCRHAQTDTMCGDCDACGHCGWFLAANLARRGESANGEWRVLTKSGSAFDFTLRTSPASIRGFGLCSLTDAYASKRLRVLERSVFHDVANLSVGIKGLLEMVDTSDAAQTAEYLLLTHSAAAKMTDEILRLRTLREAESGALSPYFGAVSAGELLRAAIICYHEEVSARKLAVCVETVEEAVFETDRELVHLILCCVVLNAIEASKRGDPLSVGCTVEGGSVVFQVRNAQVLDDDVRRHLFERSFTTKGEGKGVGLYGARLIAERYLSGALRLESLENKETVFSLRLPLKSTAAEKPSTKTGVL